MSSRLKMGIPEAIIWLLLRTLTNVQGVRRVIFKGSKVQGI